MLLADWPVREIWVYDYDAETGVPTNRRVLADLKGKSGVPDGSCVDAEGAVWNAVWEGRRVIVRREDRPGCRSSDAEADVLRIARISPRYITTWRARLDARAACGWTVGRLPLQTGVRGVVDAPFAG